MIVITQIKRNDKVNGCNILIFWLKKAKKIFFKCLLHLIHVPVNEQQRSPSYTFT